MKIAAGQKFYEQHREEAEGIWPDLRWSLLRSDGTWSTPPNDIRAAALIGDAYRPQFKEALLRAPELAWVHTENSGTDYPFYKQILARNILLTRSPGANAPEVAEFVFATILSQLKQLMKFQQQQQRKEWRRLDLEGLTGKTILIVGLGEIGSRITKIARAFDMQVLGINNTAETILAVDELGTIDKLPHFLPRADIIVLALPLTLETTNLIGAEEINLMKETAILVNIARGEIIDHEALKKALSDRPSFKACLDVVPREPLPEDDALWSASNVLLTPHIAWSSPLYRQRAATMWLENLQRYRLGKSLRDLVAD